MDLDDLNGAPAVDFIKVLGGIYEHSVWVAETALAARPFASVAAVQRAMEQAVHAADEQRQLALVKAHPDLAGKLARAGALEAASATEQAGLGLDRLSEPEYLKFEALNAAYVARFGFPFVIAVRRHTRASVLDAFERRLHNTQGEELATALSEIDAIAAFRLHALLQPDH